MGFEKRALATAVAAMLSAMAGPAGAEQEQAETVLPAVEVTATEPASASEGSESYTTRRADTATKLKLAPRETPQSVSVVTRAQIEDFQLTDVNDALETTTGVTVERVETDRTYYTARGASASRTAWPPSSARG